MCALYKGIEIPDDDARRVAAVASYGILDSAPELAYDDITGLAAQICGCPVAYIGFFDDKRQWLKAKYGLPPDFFSRPRELVLCSPTILQDDLVIIPDLTKHERYAGLPSVTGGIGARFYCGMPLINPEGQALGTLCVIDTKPRELSPEQADSMRRLSRQVLAHLELRRKLIEVDTVRAELARAQATSDRLLLNILPAKIADELKAHDRVKPRFYPSVTILFTDFTGFSRIAESMEPATLVEQLDDYFSMFDDITDGYRLEKLKTIGDAYMCAGGLPEENRSHPVDACLAALRIIEVMARVNRDREKLGLMPWPVRVGVHTGPVMAGVIGRRKFAYDVWGDAVNVAARVERSSEPGRITISEATQRAVSAHFEVERRGAVEVKGKEPVEMYFLNRIRPEYAEDGEGRRPNAAFTDKARI
ncbi:MAG: GAF domain-containing protein [Proteobacteria bacterium]|nr:GAF domain-containing protein [Pseudomonadota bacterium]